MPSAALKGERVALAKWHRARLGGVTDTNHRGVDMSAFDGRTVVVTGASGGLGAGVTAAFAAAGARVVGVAQREPAADRRVDGVRYAAADLTDDDAGAALFDGIGTPWAVAHTVGGDPPAPPLRKIDARGLGPPPPLHPTTP